MEAAAKKTILIVEDEPDLREIIATLFEDGDRTVVFAENGKVALDKIMKGLRADLIVSDLNMPFMNGLELLEELDHLGLVPPFIFVTGISDPSQLKNAMTLGAFHIVEKPFNLEKLGEIAEKALNFGADRNAMELAKQRAKLSPSDKKGTDLAKDLEEKFLSKWPKKAG